MILLTHNYKIWPQETRNITLWCAEKWLLDILNHLGVDYECDRRTEITGIGNDTV